MPIIRLLRLALIAVSFLIALGLELASAAGLDQAVKGFTTDDFGDTDTAIGLVAASGDPRAAVILDALAQRQLVFDAATKTVFIKSGAGLLDAATGKPAGAPPPASAEPVRVNNRIRRSLDAASGLLALVAPDPAARIAAAESIFKTRDAKSLPVLEIALAKEQNVAVKAAMVQARAAVLALDAAAPQAARLSAIDALKDRPNQETLSLLRSVPPGDAAVQSRIDNVAAND